MNSFLRSSHYLARQRVRVAALVAAGVLPAAMLSA
ncbi:MAG: hypothetical protein ACI9KD_001801, partial [Congregibacter sp.]